MARRKDGRPRSLPAIVQRHLVADDPSPEYGQLDRLDGLDTRVGDQRELFGHDCPVAKAITLLTALGVCERCDATPRRVYRWLELPGLIPFWCPLEVPS